VAAADLSGAVPRVRRWTLAHVPEFLTSDQVEHVLAATDGTTAKGRRDLAVLVLLARLGLRAGEVVALELDDIRWRTAEIIVRGKGRTIDSLPLLADVGQALADYIQSDRGGSSLRRLFLRSIAPPDGLAGPAAVGHIVRSALQRAGIRRKRGAAHLFRHSLATRMIRNGASLSEISEILRHRSPSSTEIYAKVSFESLRQAARPWPGTGGVS
jgi:site-specific recombinase XerD